MAAEALFPPSQSTSVPSPSTATSSNRVSAIWEHLKASDATLLKKPKTDLSPSNQTDPNTTPNSETLPQLSTTDSSLSHSSFDLKDLLVGRLKRKNAVPGVSKPRVFAGPLSWIQGPTDSSRKANELASIHGETQNGEETQLRVDQVSNPPDAAPESNGSDDPSGSGTRTDRISADLAASALAAAKAATSLVIDTSSKIEVKEVRQFAGQTVEVTRFLDSDSKAARAAKRKAEMQAESSRGLDALLAQIEKKKKLNILDKTRKDWGEYKESTGVVEELEEYKRSGATYTEKQAFLNRADVREYEKERDVRMSSRPLGN